MIYKAYEKKTYAAVAKRGVAVAIPTTLRFTIKNTWAPGGQAT